MQDKVEEENRSHNHNCLTMESRGESLRPRSASAADSSARTGEAGTATDGRSRHHPTRLAVAAQTNGNGNATEQQQTDAAYEARLDEELRVVRSIRVTMTSFLQVLETARDDLVLLGDKMDRVRTASEHCRKELMKRQQALLSNDDNDEEQGKKDGAATASKSTSNEVAVGKRKRGLGSEIL